MATRKQVLGNSWIGSERAGCSGGGRRPVNAGLLALSTLQGDVRRRLLGAWMESGRGSTSMFVPDADPLVDFIAEQLPDPSPELALCRVEQLTLRAAHRASAFEAPDPVLLNAQRVVRRTCHAGVVLFPSGSELILSKLLPLAPPVRARDATPLLVAPGLQPLCRVASHSEHETWAQLNRPTAVHSLVRNGGSPEVIRTIEILLRVGALEYA